MMNFMITLLCTVNMGIQNPQISKIAHFNQASVNQR